MENKALKKMNNNCELCGYNKEVYKYKNTWLCFICFDNNCEKPKEDFMKPEKTKTDFEKCPLDDFTQATIKDIQLEQTHIFKGFPGAEDKTCPAVRFVFEVEGMKFQHYSRWMKFNYGEKANLYVKFLSTLVEGAEPDMDFDLEALKGMKIKILWAEKNGFQFPETVRPQGKKVPMLKEIQVEDELAPDEDVPEHIKKEQSKDEEVPF